jgi:3-hydroxybutyryl-CoA dehydrogenase
LKIRTVSVIGAGVMGQGIAQASAAAGYSVSLCDVDVNLAQKAVGRIGQSLEALVGKGKISQADHLSILNRIKVSTVEAATGDLMIEAIVEKLQPKQELLSKLEINNGNSILATNTSTFPVALVAAKLKRPGRCVGLHFFNPAPVMKLVEVIAGRNTDADVTTFAMEFVKSLEKVPVRVNDSPGFIVNRVARSFYLESLKILEEGMNKESIDALLQGTGFRMGPFRLMDLIGIDTNLAVTESLYDAFGKPSKFKPSGIQQEMVRKGRLGVKTGGGFYEYPR